MVGVKELNIKQIRVSFVLILFLLTVSCNDNKKKKIVSKDHKINNISILLYGRARQVIRLESTKKIIIPDEMSDEIYLFELNQNGILKSSKGFGRAIWENGSDTNDIKLNHIENTKLSNINALVKNKIIRMAKKIYKQNEYHTRWHPSDSWLVKLKINKKSSLYYVCEDIVTNDKKLNEDYRNIIDLIVSVSPIKIREYR